MELTASISDKSPLIIPTNSGVINSSCVSAVKTTGGYLAVDLRIIGLNILNLLKTAGLSLVNLTLVTPIALVTTSAWACYNGFCDAVKDWENFSTTPTSKLFFTAMFKTCYTTLQAFFVISGAFSLLGLLGIGLAIGSAVSALAIPLSGIGLSFFVLCRAIAGLKEGITENNAKEIYKSLLFLVIGISGLVGFFSLMLIGPLSVPCLSALLIFGITWTVVHSQLFKDRLIPLPLPPVGSPSSKLPIIEPSNAQIPQDVPAS